MEHCKLATEDGTIDLNPCLNRTLNRKLKQGLKDILWQHREIMINWFDYVPSVTSKKIEPLSSVISKDSGNLSSMEKVSSKLSQSFVTTRFHMQFLGLNFDGMRLKFVRQLFLFNFKLQATIPFFYLLTNNLNQTKCVGGATSKHTPRQV